MDSNYSVEFMNQLLGNANRAGTRWGDALMRTQQWASSKAQGSDSFYADLWRTEQIFGDPAMPVFRKSPPAGTKAPVQTGSF